MKRKTTAVLMTILLATTAALGQSYSDLNGTYSLDIQKSEDVGQMVDSIRRNQNLNDMQSDELSDQLAAPDSISIQANSDKSVTIKTSSSPEVTLQGDGSSKNIGGARVSATVRTGVLRLAIVNGNASQTMTFRSEGNGLRMTKMVTASYLTQTVFVDSYYNRTGDFVARNGGSSNDDDGFSSSDPDDNRSLGNSNRNDDRNLGKGPKRKTTSGKFVVPNGTVLSGNLENKITTKASQDNDPFSMIVTSPSEYRGAKIEGYITGLERTGRVSGSAKFTMNFETITLESGKVYDFAGVLKSVTDSSGKIIEVGDEGQAKSKSRTKESVKRGGIGAGLGAIIGGILGGGKGAIIGATIGGGAGAGSVIAEGKEDLELLEGSEVKVESTSPSNRR